MPSPSTDHDLENERLAQKYRPLLVLYPEIEDGGRRRDHHQHGHGLGRPPLDQDYHPRDIRLVLDNAHLPGSREKPSQERREELLGAMGTNKEVGHLDLIDKGGPKDVEKFWRVYAEIHNKDDNPEYRRKAYVRVVRGSRRFEDYISIQYWMAYFFDDWANVHEMDWEMVSIILKKTESIEEPIACVFNAHIGGFRKPWKDVHKVDDAGNKDLHGTHPVAYVANGSHAAYFSDYPGYFNVAAPYLGPVLSKVLRITKIGKAYTDYIPRFEEGMKCFPEVEVVPRPNESGRWVGDWRWLNFQGRWGSPVQMSLRERIIARIPGLRRIHLFFQRPLREAGPTGPSAKGLCWEDPFAWVNLECFDAPRTSSWIGEMDGANANQL
jgi:hypothetical protein